MANTERKNITFEEWESRQMQDPEFREAVARLDTDHIVDLACAWADAVDAYETACRREHEPWRAYPEAEEVSDDNATE